MHKPGLLSDNGPSYVAGELAEYLADKNMRHVRGAPFHPQTQGKIERSHQTLKNRILLKNYYLPGDLEVQVKAVVEHYNHQRYHESLKTPHLQIRGSAGLKPSSKNAKVSNEKRSNIGACITARSPHNINQSDEPKHSPVLSRHMSQII